VAGNRIPGSFLVTSHEDRELLARLMRETQANNTIYNSKGTTRHRLRPDPQGVISVATCLQVGRRRRFTRGLVGGASSRQEHRREC
jgi:hypothetical protein